MRVFSECEVRSNRNSRLWARMNTALLLVASALLSCGSKPGPMTGDWALMLISGGSLDQSIATLTLRQSGNTLSGTITSSRCNGPTSVTGILSNGFISLQFAQPVSTGTLTGSVNDNFTSASGQYQVSGDWCAQGSGSGTWSAAFVSDKSLDIKKF